MDNSTGPVETKVTVGAIASAVTSFVMGWLLLHWSWLASLNDAVSVIVLAAVTAGLTFIAAWWTKTTNRTDADARKGRTV